MSNHPHAHPLPPKSVGTAYILWLLLGLVGGHHFYLEKIGRAVAYLFTLGFLGIGVLIDLFTLPSQVRNVNARRAGFGGVNVNVSNNQNVAQVQQQRPEDNGQGGVA